MPHNKLGSEKQQNGVCWKTLTIEPNENESNHYRQPVKKLPLGYSKKLSSGDSNILRPRNDLNVPPTNRKQYVDSCSPDEYDRIYDHGDNRNFPTRSYRTNATNSSIISQKKSHPDRYFLNTGPLYVRTVSKAPPKYESKSLYQKKRIHRIPTGGPTLDAIYALSKLQQQKDKNTENEITENASSFPSSPRIRRAYIKRLWRKAFIYACSVAAMSVKPPKQETRYSLKRLEKSAIDTTRRKIFVAWESILSTLEADYSYKEDEKIPVHCWIKVLVNIANVSDVEIMKLFGYIIGPTLKVNIPEKDVEEICHAVLKQSKEVNCLEDYYFSSKSHILIAIDQFKMCVQPTVYEVKEWHHASHFERLLGDEDTKMDLKLKQDYETQMKMKRETAQEKLKEAWVQSLDESLNGKISLTILNRREAEKKMKRFSTPVLKAGWGESFSAEHKKSLYYIMVSGTYGPEVPTSIVWHEVEKKYDAARISCGSMYHIPINQARLSMMNCVAYGRGLGGLLPKEAVEIFLEYLAMRCQAVFRGLKKRKRMYRAMKMWKERDFMLQKRVFSSWRCFVLKYLQFHTNCRWTFSRWKRRNRLNRNKKLYFQTVFWPWFTWKRSASVARFKRNKLNRMCNLWRACLLSRVLNTWNHLTRKRIETSEAMDRYKYMKNIKTKNIIFSAWKRFHQTTRALRHAWNRQGNLLMQNTQLEKLYIMFNCWRYFSYCSTLTKKRVRKYCLTYVEERRNAESRLNIPKSMPRRKPKDDQNKQEKRRRKTFRTKNSTSIQKTNRGKSICKQNNVVKIEHAPTFPMVQHLTWGCYLSRDIEKCCFLIHQHFKRKEHINMIAAHFILKRTRPLVLRYLHEYTCEQKKAKDVIHYFERIYLKKFFVGLKKYVKVQRKQRQNTESYNFEYDSDDSSISLRSIRSDSPYFSETKLEIDSSVRILELENNVRSIQLERFQDRVNRLKAYTLCYHKNENKNDQVPFPFLHETRQHGSALDEKDMLASEREKTLQAAHRALEYVNNIAVNAAHNLTNVLEGVFLSHEFNIKRRYFRSLRLPIMIKKVDKMFIKKKLSNFIRLCKNFVLLQNNIHRYRERTLQKSCFECWFVFLYKVNITRSCGILLFCKTEKRHVSAFDTYLEQQGMVPGFKSYELMNPLTSTIKAVFSRWVSYTAKKKIGERIIYSFRKKSQLKLLLRVFRGIKQNEPTDADSSSCFLLRRYSLDLDLMFKYTITSQRNTLSSMIRHQNYERKRAIIEGARSGPSFKKFLSEHTNLVQRRINAEQIMLEKSFKLRNCLEYNDQRITNPIAAGNNIVEAPPPCSSESVDDSAARNIHRSWNDQPPPVGFHLSEIWINVKPGQGIVGLQSIASGGSVKKIIGTRGQYYVGSKECFELKQEEQLVRVELVCGHVLERIRFSTSRGRVSRWIGETKLSIAPRLITIQSDDPITSDPCKKYIVGFFGKESSTRLLSIGIIVRNVTKQNIFSYEWIGTNDDDLIGTDSEGITISQKDKETASMEFASLQKLRFEFVQNALDRSILLARKLWRIPDRNSESSHLKPFTKLNILRKLVCWYFESIAFRLPLIAPNEEADKNEERKIQNEWKTKPTDVLLEKIQENIRALNLESKMITDEAVNQRLTSSHENIKSLKLGRIDISNMNRDYYRKLIEQAQAEVCFRASSGDVLEREDVKSRESGQFSKSIDKQSLGALLLNS